MSLDHASHGARFDSLTFRRTCPLADRQRLQPRAPTEGWSAGKAGSIPGTDAQRWSWLSGAM